MKSLFVGVECGSIDLPLSCASGSSMIISFLKTIHDSRIIGSIRINVSQFIIDLRQLL